MAQLTSGEEVGAFGWTTFSAVERKQILHCAHEVAGAHTTAVTGRTCPYLATHTFRVRIIVY